MEGMVSSTPAGEDEAEKTLMQRVAEAEESRQNKLRRMSRDLKVMICSLEIVCLSLTLNNTQDEKSKRLQEKVDSIAMYLFPCIFLVFNSIYWPYYLFYEQNRIWRNKCDVLIKENLSVGRNIWK